MRWRTNMCVKYIELVVRPTIPAKCLTPVEYWLLGQIFETKKIGNYVDFSACWGYDKYWYAAMYVLSRVNGCTQRSVSAYSAAAAKLLRAYTLQVEALRRLRNGGAQHVRVEHIQINDQARALIGPVSISAEVSQETK